MSLGPLYKKFDGLSVFLFANGWFFIVPYLLVYLSFEYLHLPVGPLKTVYLCLHLLNLPLLLNYLGRICKKAEVADFAFWIGLLLLFLMPGAYLEFPSDPWEHFRRIYAWQANRFIDENIVNYKFVYFWGWTLMSTVRPLYQRIALDVYGAFWELLLAYQFYLLALRLGFSKTWARIQVLGTICLFGANVFSFYRYYALSSTVLSYIAYLAALMVVMNLLEGRKKQAGLLPFLVLIMYFNHQQELLLLAISTSAILVNELYERAKFRGALSYVLPLVLVASWFLGWWIVKHPQVVPVRTWNLGPPFISTWGTFRIWDPGMPFFEALALHGVLALVFGVLLFNRYRRLALLTIMPVALSLFSPFVLLFAAAIGGGEQWSFWRALYAFPGSFMLIVGLKEIVGFLNRRLHFRSKLPLTEAAVLSVVLLISLIPSFPYRGRLWFVVHRPPPELSLQNIDPTSQWLFENYHGDRSCMLVGDNATGTVLAATLAMSPVTDRLVPHDAYLLISGVGSFEQYLKANQVCAFLVADPSKVVPSPPSRVGQLSGHWDPSSVNKNLIASGNIYRTLVSLTAAGWTKTPVPPFYWLYESPPKMAPVVR